MLKMNSDFLTDKVNKEDYFKYIEFIEENQKQVDEPKNQQKIQEDSNEQKEESNQKINEELNDNEQSNTLNQSFETLVENQDLLMKNESEKENVELLKFLAMKYSIENDAENTYKYMNLLIQSKNNQVPLEYAINLYKSKNYVQAFNYFTLLSKVNHPIALYFIAVMKFYGLGCNINKEESNNLMNKLSSSGIDKATEFLKNHF